MVKFSHFLLTAMLQSAFLQCVQPQATFNCPSGCKCGSQTTLQYSNNTMFVVNCTGRGLTQVPAILPPETEYLDLRNNKISDIPTNAMDSALNLRVIDLRNNSEDLVALPPMWEHILLHAIYIDEGAACCMYETDWKYSESKKAPAQCIPTLPYHECDRHLIRVLSILIFGAVFCVSLVVNPWIIIITLGYRPRRKDPITLNSVNFSCANLLLTLYCLVMFGHGIRYHGKYHHYMYGWLNNPACGCIGYLLITSTLAASVFYMLEVLMIYQKLKFPLNPEKHMTVKKLWMCAAITWVGAFFLGSIPFMTSTEGRYNRVGLCLPFYSGDYKFGFKYVFLYTSVTNSMLLTIIVLTVLLLKSFIKTRKNWHGNIPIKVAERNRMLERMLLVALGVYITINLANMAFLIMSCVGGRTGKVGREWFSRLVVIEAVTNPLLGPIRKKQFYRDTIRCLKRWGCLSWETREELSEVSSSMMTAKRRAADAEVARNESQRKLKEYRESVM